MVKTGKECTKSFPCDIGDEVFVLKDSIRGKEICSGTVSKIEITRYNTLIATTLGTYNVREFGQSIFLSEEALKEKLT